MNSLKVRSLPLLPIILAILAAFPFSMGQAFGSGEPEPVRQEEAEVVGTSQTGRGERSLSDPSEPAHDVAEGSALSDLATLSDAVLKAEDLMQEKMQGLAGGLPIPPGLKLF